MNISNSADALTNVLNGLAAIVYVFDPDSYELLYVNDYAVKNLNTGEDPEQLVGKKCDHFPFCTHQKYHLKQYSTQNTQIREFHNPLDKRWYQCRDSYIRWNDGRLVCLEIATDITEQKKNELELQQSIARAEALAHTDELTGLNNRRAFFKFARQAIKQQSRTSAEVALVFFDLDYFKVVNDTYGHEAGDLVLQAMARALGPEVRESDVLGRVGGEEFAMLMTASSASDALDATSRIQQVMNKVTVNYKGHQLACTTSFGIAVAAAKATTLNSLMAEADKALYQAKSEGRNTIISCLSAA
ncbi:GGDEF domain-containing protein [Aliidiomarina minuta]|uniref:GGDEF domain-containing protein n=1 Tax=Aliidiomarina minuta TaxID=880057 RepID=A0A432W5V3_9GAMM|nr:sensor domain-containing diguanylate cyclase [Aliidiomarina minuta]RUO25453.1 GGDEF domain-containing protein [Aliidiomarina minuta]